MAPISATLSSVAAAGGGSKNKKNNKYIPPHARKPTTKKNDFGREEEFQRQPLEPPLQLDQRCIGSSHDSKTIQKKKKKKYIPPHLRQEGSDVANNSNNNSINSNNKTGVMKTLKPQKQQPRPFKMIKFPSSTPSSSFLAASRTSRYHCGGKMLFFGDSFVRLFGLLDSAPQLTVRALKGASAKGLTKLGNENRRHIVQVLGQEERIMAQEMTSVTGTENAENGSKNNKMNFPSSSNPSNSNSSLKEKLARRKSSSYKANHPQHRWIFGFGNVDVHLSYYYKKFELGETLDLPQLAHDYVDFVASLRPKNNTMAVEITILGVYPSTLEHDADAARSLPCYGSLSQEHVDAVLASPDIQLAQRQARCRAFNRALQARCAHHGLQYADVMEEMMMKDHQMIQPKYRDVSDYNIHVVWETTLLLWLDQWPWLNDIAAAQPGLRGKLEESLTKYVQTKPWAQRQHLTGNHLLLQRGRQEIGE